MKKIATVLLAFAALVVGTLPLAAQQKRASPHEIISTRFDSNKDRVTLIYGRPYSKDPKTGDARKIWGVLVPYGKVWRTGSDEATTLITEKTIILGGTEVPAGAYTVYSQPEADGSSKLILNKQLGQWGTIYDEKLDFARIPLTPGTLVAPVDQFTMAIEKAAAGSGGTIRLMWESTQFSVDFTIKK